MKKITLRYNGLTDVALEQELAAIAGKQPSNVGSAYPKYTRTSGVRAIRIIEFECEPDEAQFLHRAFQPVSGVEVLLSE